MGLILMRGRGLHCAFRGRLPSNETGDSARVTLNFSGWYPLIRGEDKTRNFEIILFQNLCRYFDIFGT